MSLDGDEKLFEAHNIQLDFPIHSGLVPFSRTGPPLMLALVNIQTDPSSIVRGEFDSKISAFVVAFHMQDLNVHWLELEMVPGEDSMKKARLEELVEDVDAIQLHDANVHWLELEMVAGEEYM